MVGGEHRVGRHRLRRVARARGTRRLLRRRRRAGRHDPEPPPAGARRAGDGGAGDARRGRLPRGDERRAARDHGVGRRPGGILAPGAVHGGHDRRRGEAVVRRRAGSGSRPPDRDARRGDVRGAQRPLGGHAVPAALRQGSRHAGDRDRRALPSRPPPADRAHRLRRTARSCASRSAPTGCRSS